MKKNRLIFIGVALLMVITFILVRDQMEKTSDDNFVYVATDSLGPWYFDKSTIDERFDQEEGINVIDVWVKHDIDQDRNIVVRDELLWHIDPIRMRYKFSDAFAFNEEGYILEA